MTTPTIAIRVLFFARAHELTGTSSDSLVLPRAATVGEAAQALSEKYPRLAPLLDRCRLAVDQEFSEPSRELADGCELAVIPPVSGG